jgi:hypothetical protein
MTPKPAVSANIIHIKDLEDPVSPEESDITNAPKGRHTPLRERRIGG